MTDQSLFHRVTTLFIVGSAISLLPISVAHALDIPGSLHWSKRVELAMPVSGVIKTVLVNISDQVKQGDSLIKLDDRNYVAALSKAKARMNDLNEKRKEAKRQLDRAQELYDRTVLSDHDLQTAKNIRLAADSDYEVARAGQVNAELNLEYTNIRAPFDALVLQRNAEVGQTVMSQLKPETLIILAAAGEMIARGYIEQHDFDGQLRGRPATVTVAGKSYDGKVKHVGLEQVKLDKQGIYYALDIVFNTGSRILRSGQQVTIKLP